MLKLHQVWCVYKRLSSNATLIKILHGVLSVVWWADSDRGQSATTSHRRQRREAVVQGTTRTSTSDPARSVDFQSKVSTRRQLSATRVFSPIGAKVYPPGSRRGNSLHEIKQSASHTRMAPLAACPGPMFNVSKKFE